MRADNRWQRAGGSVKMCKTSSEELEKVSGDGERERTGKEERGG